MSVHPHFFVLAGLSCLPVALPAEILTISPKLIKGQEILLEVKKSRQEGEAAGNAAATSQITLTVLETGEDGSVIDWVPGATTFEKQPDNPLVLEAAKAARGVHMEVQLSRDGEFRSLRNEAEVRKRIEAVLAAILDGLAGTIPAADQARFRDMMKKAMPPSTLVAAATRDIGIYFGISGGKFEAGKPVRVAMPQPNPFGGAPLDAEVEMTLQSVNPAQNEARLHLIQRFDPAGFAEMVKQLLAQAGASAEANAPAPSIHLIDKAEYVIDTRTNLAKHLVHTRSIEAGTVLKRVDRTEIVQRAIKEAK